MPIVPTLHELRHFEIASRFNYAEVKASAFAEDRLKERDKQMRTVWDIPNNKDKEELQFGTHPTQKPVRLTERILLTSGLRGGRLLIPFIGSGTEAVAGLRYGMECVGFEIDPEYFDLARKRINKEVMQLAFNPKLDLVECL